MPSGSPPRSLSAPLRMSSALATPPTSRKLSDVQGSCKRDGCHGRAVQADLRIPLILQTRDGVHA
eukprot:scaffold70406_cov24-Tisochrysis_lutea.AAC.2